MERSADVPQQPVASAVPAAQVPPPPPQPLVSAAPVAHALPPVPASPPTPPTNRLISADGTLNTGVGLYSDCSGRTELTHASAAIDTCIVGVTYFLGHNVGVFTPLMHMGVGMSITWFDSAGVAHHLTVVSVRVWLRSNGIPPPAQTGVIAQFQTCVVPDGSVERILDAVPV